MEDTVGDDRLDGMTYLRGYQVTWIWIQSLQHIDGVLVLDPEEAASSQLVGRSRHVQLRPPVENSLRSVLWMSSQVFPGLHQSN